MFVSVRSARSYLSPVGVPRGRGRTFYDHDGGDEVGQVFGLGRPGVLRAACPPLEGGESPGSVRTGASNRSRRGDLPISAKGGAVSQAHVLLESIIWMIRRHLPCGSRDRGAQTPRLADST